MKEALKDIQDSMVNAKTDTEVLDVAIDLFGKRQVLLSIRLVKMVHFLLRSLEHH